MPVTPSRKTIVEFDSDNWMTSEPPFIYEAEMERISRIQWTPASKVIFSHGIGWRIAMHHETLSVVHERSTADASVLTVASGRMIVDTPSASGTGAKGILEEPLNQESGAGTYALPGVSAYTGGRAAQYGDQFMNVTFGHDGTATNLSGGAMDTDATSDLPLSSANTVPAIDPTVPLDRVAVSQLVQNPNEPVLLRLSVPGVPLGAADLLASLQFTGLASNGPDPSTRVNVEGDGVYRLALYGDGMATLCERKKAVSATKTWVARMRFRWSSSQGVGNAIHTIIIETDARLVNDKWRGSKITFRFSANRGSIMSKLINAVAGLLGQPEDEETVTYNVHNKRSDTVLETTPAKVKLDIRRDIAAKVQVLKSLYWSSGTLRTDTVPIPSSVFSTSEPLEFYWCGNLPTGTSVTAVVYDGDTDAALTQITTLPGYAGFSAGITVTLPAGTKSLYAILTLTANGTYSVSPTITKIGYFRDGLVEEYAPTKVTPAKVEVVSVSGQNADPSTETARLVTVDLGLDQSLLELRGSMPVRVKTQYDPADPTKYSVLFQGYVMRAKKLVKGTLRQTRGFGLNSAAWPRSAPAGLYTSPQRWGRITTDCAGEWQRLGELLTTRSFDFNIDPNAPPDEKGNQKPYKITDIIRILLANAGYGTAQYDIPDISMRMWGNPDPKQGLFLEQYTPIAPVIGKLARDYLGMYFVWDSNASNGGGASDYRGCWRLKYAPRSPFNQLCEFLTEPNWATGTKTSVNLAAYEAGTNDQGNTMLRAFIRKGSYRQWVVPPEGNRVIVTGVGLPGGGGGAFAVSSEGKLQRQLTNWISADFGQTGSLPAPNPNHPDYLGRPIDIYVCDPGLTTQQAVDFTALRIFDMACHAVQWRQFEGPLVLVTDDEDSLQLRPRKLQFGDVVIVDGRNYIVNSCSIHYEGVSGGDRFQMCAYEVFAPSPLHGQSVLGAGPSVNIGGGYASFGLY